MKKSKKIFIAVITIILASLIVICGIFGMLFKLPRAMFDKSFEDIVSETGHIPAITIYGTLHVENKEINVSLLCRKENKNYSFKEVLCVVDEKAYFVYTNTHNDMREWVLASIDLNTNEIKSVYNFTDAKTPYTFNQKVEYKDRNGFFENGYVVLNDFETVIRYDFESRQVNSFKYQEYTFPKNSVVGEKIDNSTIAINIADKKKAFSLSEMAEKSNSIKNIYEKRNRKTWSGSPQLSGFFVQNSVQMVDNKIYCMGECLNFSGEAYAVILEYDNDKGIWKYVSKFFAGDTISRKCYLVNTYNTGD